MMIPLETVKKLEDAIGETCGFTAEVSTHGLIEAFQKIGIPVSDKEGWPVEVVREGVKVFIRSVE